MRARAAYISSFVTTGIVVTGALLMLALAGALVVFHAWPQGSGGPPVAPVGVASASGGPATAFVSYLPPAVSVRSRPGPTAQSLSLAARPPAPAPASAAGLLKVDGTAPAVQGGTTAAPSPSSDPRPRPAGRPVRVSQQAPVPVAGAPSPREVVTAVESNGVEVVSQVSPQGGQALGSAARLLPDTEDGPAKAGSLVDRRLAMLTDGVQQRRVEERR